MEGAGGLEGTALAIAKDVHGWCVMSHHSFLVQGDLDSASCRHSSAFLSEANEVTEFFAAKNDCLS